jgi:hypothetical protein
VFSSTSALDGVWRSTPHPGHFTPWKETRYLLHCKLGGPQGRSGWVPKISPLPIFDPRTLQPVTSRSRIRLQIVPRPLHAWSSFFLILLFSYPHLGSRDSALHYTVGWTVRASVPCREFSLLQNFRPSLGRSVSCPLCTAVLCAGSSGRDLKLTTRFHKVPRLRTSGAIPPLPHCFYGVDRRNFALPSYQSTICFM